MEEKIKNTDINLNNDQKKVNPIIIKSTKKSSQTSTLLKNKNQILTNNINTIGDDDFSFNDNHFYQNFTEDDEEFYISSTKSPINYSIISMIDIEGDLLFNKKLFIDYNGLKNGLRNNKDGFVFFGSVVHFNGKIINDFVLNIKDDENGINEKDIFSKIFFAIFYDKILGKFFFKTIRQLKSDIKEQINFNLIVFHIQKNEIKIINNIIIQFGCSINYYIIIQLKENLIEISLLRKAMEKIDETIFIFNKKESPITIGESGKLKIPGKKKLSLLIYDKVFNYWILKDPKSEIWVYSDNKIELNKTIIFKMGREIFQISYDKNS